MVARLGLSIGNATSVVVCRTQDDAEDVVFTSPTALVLREDGTVALGDGSAAVRGFVSRVGDPSGVALSDGNSYFAEDLVANVAFGLIDTVTALYDLQAAPTITVAAPPAWDQADLRALADSFDAVGLARARFVPEIDAVSTWWATQTPTESDGPAAVVDVGVDGTTVTLLGTPAVGDTHLQVSSPSGDGFTQALLVHVLGIVADHGHEIDVDDPPTRIALIELRRRCENAKIELSTLIATTVAVELPGVTMDVPVARTTLESLIFRSVGTAPGLVDDCLLAHGLNRSALDAVILVGGSASLTSLSAAFAGFGPAVVVEQYAAAHGAALTAVDPDWAGDDPDAETVAFVPVAAAVPASEAFSAVLPAGSVDPTATGVPRRKRPSKRATIVAAAAFGLLAVGGTAAAVGYTSSNNDGPTASEQVLAPEVTTSDARPTPTVAPTTPAPPSTTVTVYEEPTYYETYDEPTTDESEPAFVPPPPAPPPPPETVVTTTTPPAATTTTAVTTTTTTVTTTTGSTTTPPTTTTTTTKAGG
ncbi:hypothetical protein GCM10007304_47740 [Rhodococcoides trifolii]|uniref:Hsp70 family protein n=1 Tax=Rhodococcoides trifolii TaxID=908250 RepID=A0A917G924_9NOCA|nr:Hsp70 family protein [Rhodococcus trifolii]GGG28342.1 hypothetical protein GCM10007304_47740 [Rhodococcus trifolii]